MERDDSAGTDARSCRICQADISGMRADAVTCSDAHKKAWQRQRAKMLDDVLPGPPPGNAVSRDTTAPGPPPGLQGVSPIGIAGAASRRLNRARNGKARVIPGGTFGLYDMRPAGVIPAGSRAISEQPDWARMAESDDYR